METRNRKRAGTSEDTGKQLSKLAPQVSANTERPGSEKIDALVRPAIRQSKYAENKGGNINKPQQSKSDVNLPRNKKTGINTESSESDDDDSSDHNESVRRDEFHQTPGKNKKNVDVKPDEKEEKPNSRQQIGDTVDSIHPFKTGYGSNFSDEEDEKKTMCHQQRAGFSSQGRITRSYPYMAPERKEKTPNIPGLEPQSLNKNIGKNLCGGITVLFVLVCIVVSALSLKPLILEKLAPNKADESQVLKDFYDGFRTLPMLFTSQSQALWTRSQRILELHLRKLENNEQPAIILLTAARDGEKTLHCVGNKLAKTYASSLNSSCTVISGPDRKSENNEDVKLEIDNKLSAGFQARARAAVLHRLELLPPGSLLILYKYCDHENAHFKNVALVLTVLLEDSTLVPDIPLNDLEEKVRDFFDKTFIVSTTQKSHNEMDVDKLSGVWSRISHVVLPVFPEEKIEELCDETESKV
ncbi:torsin-1A-interacting protein 2-like isoform X2 [Mixophyes fleayi]|uniref:torsin-1A-interacting protein 2-like isoform X2 n=1 Tax=Mixophyes fleayi TaxID=3061075 RepID=UPI003F4D82CA